MSWMIVAVLAVLAINYYLYLRFFHRKHLNRIIERGVFCILMFIGFTELLLNWRLRTFLGPTIYDFYNPILNFMMVLCLTLFTITIITDIPALILVRFQRKKLANPIYQSILILSAIGITVWGQIVGFGLPKVIHQEIKSEKISVPVTITLISDLHITRISDQDKIKNIVELVNEQKSDIIILAGDIFDDEIKGIINLAQPLKNLKARLGVYYITGNHEYYSGVLDSEALIKQLGITELENTGKTIRDDLYLAGVPDRKQGPKFMREFNVEGALAGSTESQFKILMSHQPIKDDQTNLILSGHTHCGQILPFQFIVPFYNFGMRGGLYGSLDNYNYVSCGAGAWGPQLRVFSQSDISVIKILPNKSTSS